MDIDEYISVEEASKILDYRKESITLLCRQGKFEGVKRIGHQWFIPRKSVENYVKTSIVASKREREIISSLEYKGTMHGDFFEVWFEKHLLPELSEDDVMILDDASFHRKKKLFDLAEKHNVK